MIWFIVELLFSSVVTQYAFVPLHHLLQYLDLNGFEKSSGVFEAECSDLGKPIDLHKIKNLREHKIKKIKVGKLLSIFI